MIVMGDAITPANLPAGLGAYAGYNAGRWPNVDVIRAAHPGVPILEITPELANSGECLDIENGDAIPADAPRYVELRAAAGIWRPVLYGSRAVLPAIAGALTLAGLPRSAYRLWSAHYGAGNHICGPHSCGSLVQADGTQWIDHGGWDESAMPDWFFDVTPPTPVSLPAPPPNPPAISEDDMLASTPSGLGYWICKPDGSIWSFGDAVYHGGCNPGASSPMPAGHTAVGFAALPTTPGGEQGYWILTDFDGVYSFGAAAYHGAPNQ